MTPLHHAPLRARRSLLRRAACALAGALLVLAAAGAPAWAQDNDLAEEADLAFQIGIDHYQQGQYRLALVALLRSNRLVQNKNVVFNIARCYENMRQYENAYQRYTSYVDMETIEADRQAAIDALGRIATKVALIRVESEPSGATIYLDRRDLGARGVTPRTLAVPAGPHTVIVESAGHVGAQGAADAVRGRQVNVRLQLEQILGSVEVFGEPLGAVIRLEGDDEVIGTLPWTLDLPPGQHVLVVSADGYRDTRKLVTVDIDHPLKVDGTLARLTGKVVVDASERGSLIELDGEAVGFTPAVVQAPIGEHAIRVSHRGFTPHDETITVTEDGSLELDVKLSRSGLLAVTVTTATKTERAARKAPAVVTVVERQEIQARGYRSVAEILKTVPGFYDVYDLTTHNIGVRGVLGGARASGNVIKLMIDGQPVSYRPTTGNFTGEELVPIDAIERIEIIRGPASALYGANAFLGVVNVITRREGGSAGVLQGGVVTAEGHPAWGAGVTLQAGAEGVDALVALHHSEIDRSGLFVADQSPALASPVSSIADAGRTRDDTAEPDALLGRVVLGSPTTGSGEWTVWGSVQRLKSGGEFQDFAPLTHQTRVALQNRTLRLGWVGHPSEGVAIDARAVIFDSHPLDQDQIGVGRDDLVYLRDVGVVGQEAGLEVSFEALGALQGIVGVDYTHEDHTLQSYSELLLEDAADGLRVEGTVIPGDGHGRHRPLNNLGVFAQGILDIGESLTANLGARLDQHNIYSQAISPRAGLVLAPPDAPWTGKLLFGTSFKAPSAEQLFTEPLGAGDVLGNRRLDAQTARTLELAGTYGIESVGELEANAFFTQVFGLVDFLQHDLQLEAENARDEDLAGAELAARLEPVPWLSVRLGAGVAGQLGQTLDDEQFALFALDSIVTSYPVFQGHLLAELRSPSPDLRLAPELSYVSARASSQSNTLQSLDGRYELPGYVALGLTLSAPNSQLIAGYPTTFALRGTDLLESHGPEPGFNGIDYPVIGRQLWLTVTQGF